MTLHIHRKTKIRQVQKSFHEEYPYLKLEFYNRPHGWGEVSKNADRYDPSFRIFDVTRLKIQEGEVLARAWDKTGEVEESFEKNFGLHAQVYRRNGNEWIETAGSDELTLFEQNEIGKKSVVESHDNLWIEREVLY